MNILIIAESFTLGGLETHIHSLYAHLRSKHRFVFAFAHFASDLPFEDGIVHTGFHFGWDATIRNFSEDSDKLVALIRQEHIDVIHVHPFYSIFPAIVASQITGVPIVTTYHGTYSFTFSNSINDTIMLYYAYAELFSCVFCVSDLGRQNLEERIHPRKAVFLPNAVDTQLYRRCRIIQNRRWAAISRLDGDSGRIDALKKLLAQLDALLIDGLDIYGDGSHRHELEEYVHQQGLTDRVQFMGFRSEYLDGSYNGVIAMGRASIEALSMGYPVLISGYERLCGIVDRELLEQAGRCNFVANMLPECSVEEVKAQIEKLYAEPEAYDFLDDIQERFCIDRIAQIYEQELSGAVFPPRANVVKYFSKLKESENQDESAYFSPRTMELLRDHIERFAVNPKIRTLFLLGVESAARREDIGALRIRMEEVGTVSEQVRLQQARLEQGELLRKDLQRKYDELQRWCEDLQQKQAESRKKLDAAQLHSDDLQQQLYVAQQDCDALLRQHDELRQQLQKLCERTDLQEQRIDELWHSGPYRFCRGLGTPLRLCMRLGHKAVRMGRAVIKADGATLVHELTMPFKRVYWKVGGLLERKRKLATLAEAVKEKRVVVFPPTIDWRIRLFQRPQQMAMAYAKEPGTAVIYFTSNARYDNVVVAREEMSGIWVVHDRFAKDVARVLANARQVILSVSWTPNKKYLDILPVDKLIYEYIDELEIFAEYGEEMERDHTILMKQADVTVCTASKLYDQAVGIAKNPLLSPNAGDYGFFKATSEVQKSPLLAGRTSDYQVVLGYYGALAEWFDYDTLKTLAGRHPDWLWVLVGIDYDGTLGRSGVLKLPNVCYIPPQPYRELPSFLTAFDIATIPFKINEITLSTSPIKLFEYMAAGKPIVASHMPECLKYKSVFTYESAEDFEAMVGRIRELKAGDPYWGQLEKDALANTWDARAKQILNELSDTDELQKK